VENSRTSFWMCKKEFKEEARVYRLAERAEGLLDAYEDSIATHAARLIKDNPDADVSDSITSAINALTNGQAIMHGSSAVMIPLQFAAEKKTMEIFSEYIDVNRTAGFLKEAGVTASAPFLKTLNEAGKVSAIDIPFLRDREKKEFTQAEADERLRDDLEDAGLTWRNPTTKGVIDFDKWVLSVIGAHGDYIDVEKANGEKIIIDIDDVRNVNFEVPGVKRANDEANSFF